MSRNTSWKEFIQYVNMTHKRKEGRLLGQTTDQFRHTHPYPLEFPALHIILARISVIDYSHLSRNKSSLRRPMMEGM